MIVVMLIVVIVVKSQSRPGWARTPLPCDTCSSPLLSRQFAVDFFLAPAGQLRPRLHYYTTTLFQNCTTTPAPYHTTTLLHHHTITLLNDYALHDGTTTVLHYHTTTHDSTTLLLLHDRTITRLQYYTATLLHYYTTAVPRDYAVTRTMYYTSALLFFIVVVAAVSRSPSLFTFRQAQCGPSITALLSMAQWSPPCAGLRASLTLIRCLAALRAWT